MKHYCPSTLARRIFTLVVHCPITSMARILEFVSSFGYNCYCHCSYCWHCYLITKFSDLCKNLLQYQFLPTKYRARPFINQLAKRLHWVLGGPTPRGPIRWWCSTSTCWFHIRPCPFYRTHTKLSQLSIFNSAIKCYENISFLCGGVEFQSKVNNYTSTPWNGKQVTVRETWSIKRTTKKVKNN